MKIVAKKIGGNIVCVTDGDVLEIPEGLNLVTDCDIFDSPGWDWSLADLTGIDKLKPDWVETQLEWNGITLVKRRD